MEARHPDFAVTVQNLFTEAAFVRDLGIELVSVAPGGCEARLEITPQHLQHLGLLHGGVTMTIAGHAALGAATSIADKNDVLVLPNYTMSMFRAAAAGQLVATAKVIKGGANLSFVESDVIHESVSGRRLIAKGSFTFARTPRRT